MNLDAYESFGRVDRADALADVESTPHQWSMARSVGPARGLDLDGIRNVVVTGMGGSGICGDVVAAVADERLEIPVHVHKGYGLPGFVGRSSLVLAVSYSGETEETLSAFEEALHRGARTFAVAGGGTLGGRCDQTGKPWVKVSVGGQPRHSLGLLVVPLLVALGLDDDLDHVTDTQRLLARQCGREVPTAENPAKSLGRRLSGGVLPVIYGTQGLGAVAAYRLKCQLNENAKLPAVWAQLPELNHNELAAWAPPNQAAEPGLVWVRDPAGEHPRLAARVAATEELVGKRFAWRADLCAPAHGSRAARLAALLLLADFVSIYAAIASGRDPTPIAAITALKRRLAG